MAKNFGRLGDRSHGLDDAQHGGNDAEAWKSLRQLGERMCNLVILVVLDLEILIHQCFDLVRIVRPERQQAQVVAEELYCVAVFDDVRKLRAERALLRIDSMLIPTQQARKSAVEGKRGPERVND